MIMWHVQADFLQGFFIWFNQKVYHLPSVYLQVYIADRAQADFFSICVILTGKALQ